MIVPSLGIYPPQNFMTVSSTTVSVVRLVEDSTYPHFVGGSDTGMTDYELLKLQKR